MIIDLDSHLREGYFADQVYKLATPFEAYTPICLKEGSPTSADSRRRSSAGPAAARGTAAPITTATYTIPRKIRRAGTSPGGRW
jgi:hypothetical protein